MKTQMYLHQMTTLMALLLVINIQAQPGTGMNYQGVARGLDGLARGAPGDNQPFRTFHITDRHRSQDKDRRIRRIVFTDRLGCRSPRTPGAGGSGKRGNGRPGSESHPFCSLCSTCTTGAATFFANDCQQCWPGSRRGADL